MSAAYFSEGSADEAIAANLNTGDVVLFNQPCRALPPHAAALCWASKYGISGNGRGCWDHAALVVRDRTTNVPWLLEGRLSGATLRTYEERVMQGGDSEVVVLPLRGVERSPVEDARLDALLQDLRLRKTPDGMDGPAGESRCANLWALYQQMRAPPRTHAERTALRSVDEPGAAGGGCSFGAPLVGRALQCLGALEPSVDVQQLTPAAFVHGVLAAPAWFGKPVGVR